MKKKRRYGQINFEFLAAATLYLIALGAIITSGSDILPRYQGEADRASLNLEAQSLTNQLLTEPGKHTFEGSGTNWEKNSSTVESIDSLGLADGFMELNRSKIESLSTVGNSTGGRLNYSTFKQVTEMDKQYRFRFTWIPTVDTNRSFTKGYPPSDPPIIEPTTELYKRADNEVHYGEIDLRGVKYYFLVTSHNGAYNTAYFVTEPDEWDFSNSAALGKDEVFSSDRYRVKGFQNRADDPGSLLTLSKQIKTFGASLDSDSTTIKMNRYAEMENEPLKLEVWTW